MVGGGGHHGFHFLTQPPPRLLLCGPIQIVKIQPPDSNCCQAYDVHYLRQCNRNKIELDYVSSRLHLIVGHCCFHVVSLTDDKFLSIFF